MKDQNFSQKILKFLHRFGKFSKHDLIFLWYLIILCFVLLICPIVKIASLKWDILSFRLFGKSFVWTMLIVLLSLVVLFWWNFSTKFKNLFLTYFWGRENDALVNFLFLFIIITSFLSIKNSINIASSATSTISYTGWWNFILVWLLVGIIFTLISVFKWAQKTGKKTKIINVVDEEHSQMDATKDEIKKWLFETE